MKLKAGMRRIKLQVEGRGFHSFLLLPRQLDQAVLKRICDAKFHEVALKLR